MKVRLVFWLLVIVTGMGILMLFIGKANNAIPARCAIAPVSSASHTSRHVVITKASASRRCGFDVEQLSYAVVSDTAFSTNCNDQLCSLVEAARNGKMTFDEARNVLLSLMETAEPSQALVCTEALIDIYSGDVRQRSLLEFEKIWILAKGMAAKDASVAFCRERVNAYKDVRPDSAAMLAILGGDILFGNSEDALRFYLEAKSLSDPTVHPEVKPERYGDACHQAARLLIQNGQYKHASELLKEAIAKMNPQSSWLAPCKDLERKLAKRKTRKPN